jgi:NAD-dependent protein deacetylase/lipoamidase
VAAEVAQLAELIRSRQPCVVLTGAGVSTESGIPDFRSAGGLWARVDPAEVATIDAFQRDPERVWQWYGPRIRSLLAAEPNAGHHALAAFERLGFVRAVVTQNIDTLHTRAGSSDVVEVHGSITRAVCLRCGAPEPLASLLEQLDERPTPLCRACGAVPKPDVVLFGELLPVAPMARAEQLAAEAGLLLVVGTTLEVWPVGGLPERTKAAGGAVAIVNRGPTAFDQRADLRLEGGAGEVLTAVLDVLEPSRERAS